jgi:hypothetical protein
MGRTMHNGVHESPEEIAKDDSAESGQRSRRDGQPPDLRAALVDAIAAAWQDALAGRGVEPKE